MPRKNTAGFPGKAERQRLMNALKNAKDPNIRAFSAALTTLDTVMTTYETANPPYGLAKTLKKNDKKNLMDAILKAANVGESYLAACEKDGKDMTKGAPALAEELQSLLSVNYDALSRYEPEMNLSLPELQQAARTVTVDTRGVKFGQVGNVQSSRIPMTVLDADGKQRQGFFTRETRVNQLENYLTALDKAKALCGDNEGAKAALDGFLTAFGKKNNKRMQTFKDNANAASKQDVVAFLGELMMKDPVEKGDAKTYLQNAGVDVNSIPPKALDAMDEALLGIQKDAAGTVSVRELNLQDGARLDDRNVSMSAVADLMGLSKLVAKSTPMRCVDQEGNVVEGSFMDLAEGEDLNNHPERIAMTTDDPKDLFATGEGSHFAKDLLDLQVLDYICGNVDRHDGNMSYKLNSKGQIVGLQAFDNDSSFGLFSKDEAARFRMTGLNGFRILSKSMYERINTMTPEMLKLSLRGTGRTEEEIKFACERLNDLKQLIKDKQPTIWPKGTRVTANNLMGGLHVVDDDDLSYMNVKSLMVCLPGDSTVSRVIKGISDAQAELKQAGGKEIKRAYYEANKAKFDRKFNAPEAGTTERKHTAAGLGDSLQEAAALYKNEATGKFIEKDTGYWCKSSGEFRDMVRAAAKAAKLQKELTQRLSKDPDKEKLLREDPSIKQDKDKADAAINKLAEETEKYLNRKRTQRHAENDEQLVTNAKNDYERERIRYALSLKNAVRNYRELDNPNAQRENQEKQTVRTVVETSQKREEVKAQQAGPAAHA